MRTSHFLAAGVCLFVSAAASAGVVEGELGPIGLKIRRQAMAQRIEAFRKERLGERRLDVQKKWLADVIERGCHERYLEDDLGAISRWHERYNQLPEYIGAESAYRQARLSLSRAAASNDNLDFRGAESELAAAKKQLDDYEEPFRAAFDQAKNEILNDIFKHRLKTPGEYH